MVVASSPRSPAPQGALVMLSPSARITVVDVATKAIVLDTLIVDGPTAMWTAAATDARTGSAIAVLTMPGRNETRVLEISRTGSPVVRTIATLDASSLYSWVDAGQSTGAIYLISDVADRVRKIDRTGGRELESFRRDAGALSDHVYLAAMAPSEHRLYVSYHGAASGIDWFDLREGKLLRCSPERQFSSCIGSHGFFIPAGGGVWADLADGNGIIKTDSLGHTIRLVDPQLPGNHMVSFDVDARSGTIYSLGDCGYAGRLSGIARNDSLLFKQPDTCGQFLRLSLDGTWLAVLSKAQLGRLASQPAVEIFDAATGVRMFIPPGPASVAFVMPIR